MLNKLLLFLLKLIALFILLAILFGLFNSIYLSITGA